VKRSVRVRITAAWALLVVATLVSFESAQAENERRWASSAVLLISLLKARIIGLEFMELRSAPWALRLAFELWVVGVCAALLGLYWWLPAAS
jgi:hypothetical protein